MKTIPLLSCALVLATLFAPAHAKEAATLDGCVTLSAEHAGARAGNNTQLLLRDGPEHYRVRLDGTCQALYRNSSVRVETEGQVNRLCPTGTSVRAGNVNCAVQSVELLTSAEYKRYARRNR